VRNVFLALLVANLAYFAWAHWVDVPPPPPVNEAIEKLPRLKLAEEVPPAQRPQSNAAGKTALNDSAGCFSVGPFLDLDNSAHAAALLRAKGFDPQQRAEEGQPSDGYWVYVGGIQSQAEVDKALVTLERNDIKDAIVMPETADSGRRLSLGVYSERARAEKRAQAVRAQTGLKVEVAERKLPGTIYWVDLSPLQGMNSVPLQDLLAEGVSSRIAVQPCPAAAHSSAPTGTATTGPAASRREATTAGNPAQAAAPRQLP
jgi:SPOR domain